MPHPPSQRVEWLKSVRSAITASAKQTEEGLSLLNGVRDEHIRNATETWLEQQRTSMAKLDRRIQLEQSRDL